jgi:hypothetical protein
VPANDIDKKMADAIEHALWQDVADALNRLGEWGADPLLSLADKIGENSISVLDPAEVHQKYRLRYQPPFVPDPDNPGRDLPFGWQVEQREEYRP